LHESFCNFFNGFKISIQICVFLYQYYIFEKTKTNNIKNAEFHADFKSIEKVVKNAQKKL
jgi:hypothetical protein